MRCPECVAQDQRSKVYPGGTMSTLMCVDRFYDEDGVPHRHDPNAHTTDYHCSNGHYWHDSVTLKCPVEGCAYA